MSTSSPRRRAAVARHTWASLTIGALIGVGIGACVDRSLELPLHERLSKDEVCEIYCDMELNCPNFRLGFNSDCFDVCMDPRRIWPEMDDECAEVHFLRYACWVDIGCENLPDPPEPGEHPEQLCTFADYAPDFVYTHERCGQVRLDDGG